MSDAPLPASKPSSIRHTRAVSCDRSKRATVAPSAPTIETQLTELLHPAVTGSRVRPICQVNFPVDYDLICCVIPIFRGDAILNLVLYCPAIAFVKKVLVKLWRDHEGTAEPSPTPRPGVLIVAGRVLPATIVGRLTIPP